MIIYCVGPEESYGSKAAHQINDKYFGGSAKIIFCCKNTDILLVVENSETDAIGFVPVRNSSGGLVTDVMKFLLKSGNNSKRTVIGDLDIIVNHCLSVRPGVLLKDIKKIFSHRQGFDQCRGYLFDKGFTQEQWQEVTSTSLAAKMVSEGTVQ